MYLLIAINNYLRNSHQYYENSITAGKLDFITEEMREHYFKRLRLSEFLGQQSTIVLDKVLDLVGVKKKT
jgi:hypothetical protein